MSEQESGGFLHEVLSARDTLDLNRAFVEIEDNKVRRSIINLVGMLGD